MNNYSDPHRKQLKEFRRLANQMASMHSMESDRYSNYAQWLSVGGLVFSAFLLALAMICELFVQRTIGISPDAFKWIMGLLAFLNFSIILILLAWRPFNHAAAHREAVERYTRIKREIDNILENQSDISIETTNNLKDAYLDTSDQPKIKDSRFNKLKQAHLIKVEVSRALSVNPHKTIRNIKKELAKPK